MANIEKIVEELSSLTVMEAAELSKALEEKLGVSAAAALAVPHHLSHLWWAIWQKSTNNA